MLFNYIIEKINGWNLYINDIYDAIPSIQRESDNNLEILSSCEDQLYDLEKDIALKL